MKYLPYLVVFIAGAIICFLLFKGCGKAGPDHSSDKREMDSTGLILKANNDKSQKTIDSIASVNQSLKKASDSLSVLVKASKYGVNVKGGEIAGLIAKIQQLESSKDTSAQITNCDSLQGEVTDAIGMVGHFEYLTDSLETTLKTQISNKDTIISRLDTMFTQTNNQLFANELKYDQLYNDYNKINKKLKFSRGLGKGIAIAAILIAAKAFIK